MGRQLKIFQSGPRFCRTEPSGLRNLQKILCVWPERRVLTGPRVDMPLHCAPSERRALLHHHTGRFIGKRSRRAVYVLIQTSSQYSLPDPDSLHPGLLAVLSLAENPKRMQTRTLVIAARSPKVLFSGICDDPVVLKKTLSPRAETRRHTT